MLLFHSRLQISETFLLTRHSNGVASMLNVFAEKFALRSLQRVNTTINSYSRQLSLFVSTIKVLLRKTVVCYLILLWLIFYNLFHYCVASWNENHIAITRWSLCVDIDLQFSGTLVVYLW